jgi:hypothetical protein
MRRLILGLALLAIIVGAAALGFAARGHATSKQDIPCPALCHVNANGTREIDLHRGDHLHLNTLKVFCSYSLGPAQLTCFGPGTKGNDPELGVTWTRGAVQVNRCWNDCAKKEHLLTARR